jgi:hypothetical protein
MGGRSFPRAFERRIKFLFIRRTFIQSSRDMYKKALEKCDSLIGAPLGNLERGLFLGDFERQRKGGSRDM